MILSSNEIHRIIGFVSSDPVLMTMATDSKSAKECQGVLQLAIDKVIEAYGDPTGMWKNLPAFMRPTVLKMTAEKLLPHVAFFPKQFQNVITTVARS